MTTSKNLSQYQRTMLNLFPTVRRGCPLRYLLTILVILSSATVPSRALEECLGQPINGVCRSSEYLNSTRSCCMQCTNCNLINRAEETPCNGTHDAVCVPLCPSPKRWSSQDLKCVISDCGSCPSGECREGLDACLCDECYTGDTCSTLKEECRGRPEIPEPTVTSNGEDSSLNPVTIGLIAIGVVIGIVAFSSCFLLFGLCTTKQRRIADNQSSENSESGLVTVRGYTNSTRSSYMSGLSSSTTAYLNNRSMLELLRHSNTPVHSLSGSSSIRSSPKSYRSSPKLVRTSPLAPEKFCEKGLITSVWWYCMCVYVSVCSYYALSKKLWILSF